MPWSVTVISHQIRVVLSPDQTLVYLPGAKSQTSASIPPGLFICLPLSLLSCGVVCAPDLFLALLDREAPRSSGENGVWSGPLGWWCGGGAGRRVLDQGSGDAAPESVSPESVAKGDWPQQTPRSLPELTFRFATKGLV